MCCYSSLCKPGCINPIEPACCRRNLLTRGTLADLPVHTIFPLQYTAVKRCRCGVVLGITCVSHGHWNVLHNSYSCRVPLHMRFINLTLYVYSAADSRGRLLRGYEQMLGDVMAGSFPRPTTIHRAFPPLLTLPICLYLSLAGLHVIWGLRTHTHTHTHFQRCCGKSLDFVENHDDSESRWSCAEGRCSWFAAGESITELALEQNIEIVHESALLSRNQALWKKYLSWLKQFYPYFDHRRLSSSATKVRASRNNMTYRFLETEDVTHMPSPTHRLIHMQLNSYINCFINLRLDPSYVLP